MSASVFPLTPLQEGMLYHHLLEPHGGVDVLQVLCAGSDPLDTERLRDAWRQVTARHEALRTAFRWDGRERAVQLVEARVDPPFAELDWRGIGPRERERRRDDLLRTDRTAGIALDRAPLFRLTLIRLDACRWELLWTLHHAILDGTGFCLVLNEVFAVYERGAAGLAPPVPFRAHADWLERLDPTAGAAWWRERLRGCTAPTPLPLAAADGARANGLAGACERVLDAASTGTLASFGSAHGVPMDVLLQAAWAIVLARHADGEDVLFGTVRACRRSSVPGSERIAGLLMNTLPARVRVERGAPLVPWLQALTRARNELRAYEHTPLARVQAWSEIAPPLPLFETLVNYSPRTVDATLRRLDPGWERRSVRQIGRTNVPLALVAWGGQTLTLRLQYDGARIAASSAAVVAEHLETALATLPYAARAGEVALEAATCAPPAAPLPAPLRPVCVTFLVHARRAPDTVAVRDGASALTYGELSARSGRVAAALRARGVRNGTPVGMTFERSVDAIVALLAILRAGGAYVPLVPDLPDARWAQQAAAGGVRLAITTAALRARLPADVEACCLETVLAGAQPERALPDPDLDDAAYVLFTSGSSGEPKGVQVTHRNLAAYAAAIAERLGLHDGAPASFASVSTLAADLGNTSVFGALTTGGTLHLVPPETATNAARFAAYATAHPFDVLKITPSHLRALLEGDAPALFPRRWLVLGGEAASPAFAERLLGAAACRVLNHYGPTETTVGACTFELTAAALDAARAAGARTVPIGTPLAGAWIAVLDADGAPVPTGVAGELYVGGAGVARGYAGDAARTAERFVHLPARGRAYRTGDRVRRLPSGDLEFLGRCDRQVKIRGYRVEPAEIEAVLLAHPVLAGAAVVADDGGDEPRLLAYVVAARGANGDVAAIARAHLAARLPAQLVPSGIVVLPELPLTANGKLDRAALTAGPAPAAAAVTDEPPRTPTERRLAGVWREVLGCPAVGRHADFFALGGHSLAAIRVLGRISRSFGVRLPLRALFDAPTLAGLAAAIDGGARSTSGDTIAPAALRNRSVS